MHNPAFIFVTDMDQLRIQNVIINATRRDLPAIQALENELSRAVIVPAEKIPDTVITMRTRFVFEDEATHEEREITLVYPVEADPKKNRISVLSPLGTALLGLSVGQSIDWEIRKNHTRRFGVVEILYQPEASGHYHL